MMNNKKMPHLSTYLPYLSLSDRNREVITKYLSGSVTYSELGREYGVSINRIGYIIRNANLKAETLYKKEHPELEIEIKPKALWEMNEEELWDYTVNEESERFPQFNLSEVNPDPEKEKARITFLKACFELNKESAKEQKRE